MAFQVNKSIKQNGNGYKWKIMPDIDYNEIFHYSFRIHIKSLKNAFENENALTREAIKIA